MQEQQQPITECHVAPNCPRCASTNTKFCYYNNYSLTQPRYFCKGCRRYWTKGGSLRNVPVGGGCRKTRRSRSRSRAHHHNGGMGSSASDQPMPYQVSGGPDIDMAAVFARYVSQDAPKNDTCCHDVDLESFDYEMLVTDDVFWSTASEEALTANWEAMAPLEELDEQFGSPNLENDLLVSNANWSCFDLPGYGDFYRPL